MCDEVLLLAVLEHDLAAHVVELAGECAHTGNVVMRRPYGHLRAAVEVEAPGPVAEAVRAGLAVM